MKSIGEGLPFGLNAFEFKLDPNLRVVHVHPDHGGPERFNAHLIDGTDSCAALVIRTLAWWNGTNRRLQSWKSPV